MFLQNDTYDSEKCQQQQKTKIYLVHTRRKQLLKTNNKIDYQNVFGNFNEFRKRTFYVNTKKNTENILTKPHQDTFKLLKTQKNKWRFKTLNTLETLIHLRHIQTSIGRYVQHSEL